MVEMHTIFSRWFLTCRGFMTFESNEKNNTFTDWSEQKCYANLRQVKIFFAL